MFDYQHNGLLMGWAPMVSHLMATPSELGWGQCMMTHMFFEMHEIMYQERKSFSLGSLVLQIWAWEHIPVCRPICESECQLQEPVIYIYLGYVTQVHMGHTKYWRHVLDDMTYLLWHPYLQIDV